MHKKMKDAPVHKRLKEARIAAGLTQRQLGIKAGIDKDVASARMNQYETGKHIPDYITLKKIGQVLGKPVAYFYTEDLKEQRNQLLVLIGQKIRILREEQNFTQDEFALIANMERSYFGRVERGEQNMSMLILAKLCLALKCDPSVILPSYFELKKLGINKCRK